MNTSCLAPCYIAQACEKVDWPIAYKVSLLRQDRIPPLTGPFCSFGLGCPDLIGESADPTNIRFL